MHREHGPAPGSLVLLLCGIFLLASPFLFWLLSLNPPWFTLHLIWLSLTVATAVAARNWRHDDA